MENFGDLLKEKRADQEPKLTQADIAESADVGAAAVCDWERGHRGPPTKSSILTKALERFARADACALAAAAMTDRGFLEFETVDGDSERTEVLAKLCLAVHGPDSAGVISEIGGLLNRRSGSKSKSRKGSSKRGRGKK